LNDITASAKVITAACRRRKSAVFWAQSASVYGLVRPVVTALPSESSGLRQWCRLTR